MKVTFCDGCGECLNGRDVFVTKFYGQGQGVEDEVHLCGICDSQVRLRATTKREETKKKLKEALRS